MYINKIMIRVGVMGGIGSGKSLLLNYLNIQFLMLIKKLIYIYKKDKNCFKKLKKNYQIILNLFQ